MKRILAALFSGTYQNILGFKGGTLAYLHYHLPRFSTDIDLDLLDLSKEQEILEYITVTLVGIGHTDPVVVGRDLHRRIFHYDSEGRNIKIELNKRKNPYTQYEFVTIDEMTIYAQTRTSMVTNKLLALGKRRYNRDLYDIHYFLTQGYGFDENIIQEREQQSLGEWIQIIIREIPDHFQSTTVLHQLGEVLDTHQKPRVKTHLVTETIDLLERYLDTH